MSDPLDNLSVPTERPENGCVYALIFIGAFWTIVAAVVYALVA